MFFDSGMLVWLSCVLFVCCMHTFIYDIKIWKLYFYIFIAREINGKSYPLEDMKFIKENMKLIKENGYVNSVNWNTLLTNYTLQKKSFKQMICILSIILRYLFILYKCKCESFFQLLKKNVGF